MGGYAIRGEEPAPENPETLLLFERGKLDERWFLENVLDPKYGRDNVIRQKAVLWPPDAPIGELHSDAFVVSEGMPFEVKSHADGESADFDFVQLAGQILFDEDADDTGVLVVIDRNLKREYLPVVLTDDMISRVEKIAADVTACAHGGPLPDRVCSKPADGRSRMCPFVGVCFADWEPPDPIRLDGDVARLAVEAMQAQERKRAATKATEAADVEYRELVSRLAEHELEPGLPYVGAGVTVKVTRIEDSERFSLPKARKAGVWTAGHDELFGPFVSLSGGHERWSFEPNTVQPSADDFGSDAPWSDSDLVEEPTF